VRQQVGPEERLQRTLKRQRNEIARRMEAVEGLLSKREAELSELEMLFANPELYRDGSRTAESVERHRVLKEEIRVLTAEWEQLLVSAEQLKQ
jgi:hypothetical protein